MRPRLTYRRKLLSLSDIARLVAETRGSCSKQAVAGVIRRRLILPIGRSPRGDARYGATVVEIVRDHLRQPNAKRAA